MSRPRGFTLIECIMAVILLLIGFLAVAAVFPASYRGAAVNQNHTTAVRVAQNVLDSIRAHPYGTALAAGFPAPVIVPGEVEGTTSSATFTPSVTFDNNSAVGGGTESSDVATVTVNWTEGTAVGSAGINKTLTVRGGISRDP